VRSRARHVATGAGAVVAAAWLGQHLRSREIDDAATFLAQLEAVGDRLVELLTSGQTSDGCECALELPQIRLTHIDPRPPAPAE
jgi:hypothetical protein